MGLFGIKISFPGTGMRWRKSTLLLLLLLLLGAGNSLLAQVKIGNNPSVINPASILELESTNKGLLLTRLQDTSLVANPPDGMLIFVINASSGQHLYVRQSQSWQQLATSSNVNDLVLSFITKDSRIKDSVMKAIRLSADSLATRGFIDATGGDSSLLKKVILSINMQRFRDSIATALSSSPVRDSLLKLVAANTKATTVDSLKTSGFLTVTGGDSSVLKKILIGIDAQRFRDSIAVALTSSPVKDSLANIIYAQSLNQSFNLALGAISDSLVVIRGNTLKKIAVDSLLLSATGFIDPVGIYKATGSSTVFPASPSAYPGNGNFTFEFNEAIKFVYTVPGARLGDAIYYTTSTQFNEYLQIGKITIVRDDTVVVTVINGTETNITPTDMRLTLSVIKAKR